MPAVSSVAAVLPPHVPQRRRHQSISGLAEGESAGWNKIGAMGGHWFDRAVPTGRAHKRHVISATKIRRYRGDGGEHGMLAG